LGNPDLSGDGFRSLRYGGAVTMAVMNEIKHQRLGKEPLVILTLAQWREIEAIIEDYEMMRSLKYRKSIAESRRQIKEGKVHRLDLKTGKFKRVETP